MSEALGAYSRKLPGGVVLQRLLGELQEKVFPEDRHQPVGKQSGQTNHVERWNGTLRQRLGPFVRKALSFSKSEEMHEICLLLFLHYYNRLCLRTT